MSLGRRALFAVARSRPVCMVQSRKASSSHDHHEDAIVYPPESESQHLQFFRHSSVGAAFMNSFWGKVLFFTLLTGAAIRYAPEPNEDVYLTRWIAMYKTSPEVWLELNAKHTAQEFQVSKNNLLVADAQPPPIHRFRYPQSVVLLLLKFIRLINPQVAHARIPLPQPYWRGCGYAKCACKDRP